MEVIHKVPTKKMADSKAKVRVWRGTQPYVNRYAANIYGVIHIYIFILLYLPQQLVRIFGAT